MCAYIHVLCVLDTICIKHQNTSSTGWIHPNPQVWVGKGNKCALAVDLSQLLPIYTCTEHTPQQYQQATSSSLDCFLFSPHNITQHLSFSYKHQMLMHQQWHLLSTTTIITLPHSPKYYYQGIQFLQKGHLQRFRDLIFADGCSRIEKVCWGFYFADLIFIVCRSTAKIGSLKNFRSYGSIR